VNSEWYLDEKEKIDSCLSGNGIWGKCVKPVGK